MNSYRIVGVAGLGIAAAAMIWPGLGGASAAPAPDLRAQAHAAGMCEQHRATAEQYGTVTAVAGALPGTVADLVAASGTAGFGAAPWIDLPAGDTATVCFYDGLFDRRPSTPPGPFGPDMSPTPTRLRLEVADGAPLERGVFGFPATLPVAIDPR
jgi:hypothetical protein